MRLLVLMSVLILQLASPRAALAAADTRELKALDRQILMELIEVARFNVQYQRAVTHHARWRNAVYPLAQEGCYAGFMGYSITDMHEHIKSWNQPSLASKTALRRGLTSATVGALLGSGSSSLELLTNALATRQLGTKGFSSEHSICVVNGHITHIDRLIAARDVLMRQSAATGRYRELLELKGELCKYERDRLIFEFKRWNVQSKGYAWYKNSFYIMNVAANWIRFAALQAGRRGLNKRTDLGAVGPTLLTSSIIASAAPALSTAIGRYVARRHALHLAKELNQAPFLSDTQARQQFTRLSQLLAASGGPGDDEYNLLRAELALLRRNRVGLDNLINVEERQIAKLHRVAAQQTITAPIVGAVTAGSGTVGTVNYYGYRLQPKISNRIGFAGDFGTLTGESVALTATPLASIAAYRYERELKRKGEHPDQLLTNRLRDIDALEALVKEK